MSRLHAIVIEFLDTGCIVKTVTSEDDTKAADQKQFACSTLIAGKDMVIGLIDQNEAAIKATQS